MYPTETTSGSEGLPHGYFDQVIPYGAELDVRVMTPNGPFKHKQELEGGSKVTHAL